MVKTIPAIFDGNGFSPDELVALPINTRVQLILVVPDRHHQTLVTTVRPPATTKVTEKIQALKQLRGQLAIEDNIDTLRQLDLQKLNQLNEERVN